MWIMTPYGILMPAVRPNHQNLALPLQIRARDRRALVVLGDWMHLNGLPCTEIYPTPDLDYDYRVYTTHAAFAEAITADIMAIDYGKFKPQTRWNDLHDLYNRIWGVVFVHYDNGPIIPKRKIKRGK